MSTTPAPVASLARLTPSDTTRRASTSRPESVSSRIAIRGRSSSIWRISWRFFSPPEKPSLTLRSANAGSMRRFPMAPFMSLTQVRSFGDSPSMAVLAVRRKFDTDTPGTSTGYCIARKSPARARSSTMIAWVSPDRIVRVTPRRISVAEPSSVWTETWRSLISRVVMRCSALLGQGDVDVVALDADGVDGDGDDGGRTGGVARTQVEAGPVEPALDGAAVELALGQRDVGVGARVVDAVHVTVLRADDGDPPAVDLGRGSAHRGKLVEAADPDEAPVRQLLAHRSPPDSSCSMDCMSRSCTSRTPMRPTTLAKKPRTTRRRASSSGIPRAMR